jgi:hypothetical protein
MQNLIFSLTPEDYSTSHCARLSLSLGSPGGSAGTAWLWDVVLKVVSTADSGNNVARSSEAPLRDVELVRARRKSSRLKEMAPQVGLEPTNPPVNSLILG